MNPLKSILRTVAHRAARSYVAGPHLQDAIDLARTLESEGVTSTIAYWNNVGDEPAEVYAAQVAAIDGAAAAALRAHVSIKAPALAMSETFTSALAGRCRDRGIGLHFDSKMVEQQAPTFDLIGRLTACGAALGCTLPARFERSLEDVERAVAQRLRVRVVKGQWADPGHPIDPRQGFMQLIDRLAGRAAHVAVATHDAELAERALVRLSAAGTPAELELIHGLPMRAASDVARRLHVPVRVYIPYGHAWLPYAASGARRNPKVLWWLMEDAVRRRMPLARRRP
jgi:proline dehydrogenase